VTTKILTPVGHSASEVWVFAEPSLVWEIVHNFGHEPLVQTYLTNGTAVIGEPTHPTVNTTLVSFVIPTAGKAVVY
jgi:hypothetical protein